MFRIKKKGLENGFIGRSFRFFFVCLYLTVYVLTFLDYHFYRVSFGLEPGAVGQRTDFKEANRRLEWGLKKAIIS